MVIGKQASILKNAVLARCPKCGRGGLFQKTLQLRKDCSKCGLDYAFIDTGDGPAIFAIFILGLLVLGAALWFEFAFAPPLWMHLCLWGILTPLVALLLLRFIKALFISLQYVNDASEGRLQ
ncbi:MAG: DUF983 domain-containing protein [Hyphomicrobium sp.]